MSSRRFELAEAHPLVEVLERNGGPVVELRGYPGGKAEGLLRLYPDARVPTWLEIPVDSILHSRAGVGDDAPLRVYLDPAVEIVEVSRRKRRARELPEAMGGEGGIAVDPTRPRLPRLGANTCIGLCEKAFADDMARALQYFAEADQAADGGDADLAARLNWLGAEIKRTSIEALGRCLERCQPFRARTRILPDGTLDRRRPTLEEIKAEILDRVLGSGTDGGST